MTSRAPLRSATTAGFLLLSALLVGTIWVIPYLPTNDGPEGILAVHIENHFGDAGTLYRDVFTPAPQFAGRGFTILYEPLEELLGWRRGLQVALSIIVLTAAWGMVALVGTVDPRRLPLAFLGFPLALSWCLYMGFFPFVFAGGVGLLVLAVALQPATPARRVAVAALLLLQAFLHMFAAVLTGFVIALTRVVEAPRGRRLLETAKVALMALPAASLAAVAVLVARRSALTPEALRIFQFLPIHDTLVTWPRTLAPGPLGRALVVAALTLAAAGVALFRILRAEVGRRDRAFSVLALLFLLTSLFGPFSVPGWQLFSQRFVWLGEILLVAALPFERLQLRARRAVAGACFLGALLALSASYPFHLRLEAASADAIAGLSSSVARKGVFLPVTLEPNGPRVPPGEAEVPHLAPLRHIGSLYATALGGLIPYTFANNPATWPFTIRPDAVHPPPIPPQQWYLELIARPDFQTDPALRSRVEGKLATYGMYYEGVLLTGARAEDFTLWRERGYVAEWKRGSVMLARFQPCRIDLTVPAGAGAPLLDVGVDDSMTLRDAPQSLILDAQGAHHVVVERGPCGRVWVRPHWPATDVGAGVAFCENATPTGELATTITRTQAGVVCTGVRADR